MTDSAALAVQLRQALAGLEAPLTGPGSVAGRARARIDVVLVARAVLVHLEGEQQRLAEAFDEGVHERAGYDWADLREPQVFNPYRREEQTNG